MPDTANPVTGAAEAIGEAKAAAAACKQPAAERYVRPQRASSLMRNAQSIRQTVYIFGATGCGKTSFVADFLARRKYEYLSMAEGYGAGQLASFDDGRERIVVLDDLQALTLPEEREACRDEIQRLAENPKVWLVLISRCAIPAWLMPVHIRCLFVSIGETELALSETEQQAYLEKWGLASLTQEAADRLRELCCGHPLALRIAAIRLAALPRSSDSTPERVRQELAAIEAARADWWDWLETHVYDQWEVELQEFLMDVSVLEEFDLDTARLLTGKSDAGRLITMAQETGHFLSARTEDGVTVYTLHRSMKLSMRRRLEKHCSREHIDGLYRSAGRSYELAGRVLDALAMYEKCHYGDGISRLLIDNARKYAGSGYYWELRKYYLALPEDSICRSPELMAGMSLLQSILMNDAESERWYRALEDYAKSQTGSVRRDAQARLFYLDIALPQRGTGQMTDILKKAWTFVTERKAILPELSLTNNQPSMMNGGKDFCEWSRRDRELARTIGKPVELLMGKFGKGLVNLALAESFFEKGGDNYEVSVLAGKGRIQAEGGGKPEQVFVAVGILAWLSVLTGRVDDALESVESFRRAAADNPRLTEGVDTLRARLLLYLGRSADVSAWIRQAPDEDEEFCTLERYRYVTKARVYLSAGRREKALNLLTRLLAYAEARQRTYLLIEATVLLAVTKFRLGDTDWQPILQDAVTRAEDYRFVRILTREGAALWELLRAGTFTWRDESFQKQVLSECESMAQLYPVYLREKQDGNILLSDKALKILRLQAEGATLLQIADAMGLSKAGVKYYNRETYKQLGVNSKAAALVEARNRKII